MSWFSRVRRMLQRDRLEKDLDEELRSHLDMRAADNMAAGMTPEEAGRDARRRFGNVTALKEDTRAMDIIGWLDTAARDVQYAVRLLRKSPGFTLASVLTLTLGVIGTTLVFTAIVRSHCELWQFATPRAWWSSNGSSAKGARARHSPRRSSAISASIIGVSRE